MSDNNSENNTSPTMEEKTKYDNFLDYEKRVNDEYNFSLERFLGENVEVPIDDARDRKRKKKQNDDFKTLNVHFQNRDDIVEFSKLIGQVVYSKQSEYYYPREDPRNPLASFIESSKIDFSELDPKLVEVTKKEQENLNKLDETEANIEEEWWKKHWKEMPHFRNERNFPYRSIVMHFREKEDYEEFCDLFYNETGNRPTLKTKFLWYPETRREKVGRYSCYIDKDFDTVEPKYPMYIVSKGRYDSLLTSRALARMWVKHYIVVETHEAEKYRQAVKDRGIEDFAEVLVAPFSNHGDGPGRARNWVWDHSMELGYSRHWVLDDNIRDFLRLNENSREFVYTGAIFRAMEDFVDRYKNVRLAGPHYKGFVPAMEKKPPFIKNTRIYSCLLIDNSLEHRWRGRYNEDTDLSLRVLKDGDCTVQFNAFIQDKEQTQVLKGGNTDEFYHAEGETDESKWNRKNYNPTGTINKSKMLVDMHPDVATLVWRYDRWHHYVNYDVFQKNPLEFKDHISLKPVDNEYNMMFVEDYYKYKKQLE